MAAPTELASAPGARQPRAPAPAPDAAAPQAAGSRLAGAWQRLWWTALAVAALFCWITFYAKGGLKLGPMTSIEMVLTVGAGLLIGASVIVAPARGRVHGLWPAALLLGFAMLTALSIVWSVQPDSSWQDSGRMLAYAGVFCAGVALAHVAPTRWPALLGGLTLAATIVCGYAALTKVFPDSLDPSNSFARLNEPYGYWNAVGLSAALGVLCCLWLGARRDGHALLRALAYPAVCLALVTLALAYSRGALAALALGLALWFCVVPLRLRSAALLLVGGLGAAVVVGWDFSRHALSSEGVPLAERTSAGHELGALLAAMLVLLALAGVAIGFTTARRAPSPFVRRRAGAVLLAALVLALVAFAGALAHSQRGFTGTIAHDFHALTDPNAKPPPNTPGRLTAVASVRARYWKEALQVFDAHPLLGVGAEGFAIAHLRYETQTLEVRHAHGFVVQTLADLGLVGLALALALLLTWMAAAGRATHPFNRRWTRWRAWRQLRSGQRPGWRRLHEPALTRYTPERVGMLAMLCLVVTFGVHSFVDWTWYVPGDACVALLCAGWLAGRGELVAEPHRRTRPSRAGYVRVTLAALVVVAALLAAWSEWQPQRAEEANQQALALLAHSPSSALAAAESAVSRDPLSVEALFTLSTVQRVAGERQRARATLERAVRLQPSNPQTWLELGRFQLTGDPAAAVKALQAAIYLDPESVSPEAIAAGNRAAIEVHNDYIQALEAQARLRSAASQSAAHPSTAHPSTARRGAGAVRGARLKTARGSRSPAAHGLLRELRRLGGLRATRSRTRPAAP
ncbi:MAG TPA: O-antigen ligase family protein [Solirubrobacteraceae bacterium]|nr:O-antigen ligase family protein [Solirubrobacteraceae bacterium]